MNERLPARNEREVSILSLRMELNKKIQYFESLQHARRALIQDFRRVQEERARTKTGHESLRDPEAINASIEEVDDRLQRARREIESLKIALFEASNQHSVESNPPKDFETRDQPTQ